MVGEAHRGHVWVDVRRGWKQASHKSDQCSRVGLQLRSWMEKTENKQSQTGYMVSSSHCPTS